MIAEETKVSPSVVWNAWSQAHALHGQSELQNGSKGQMQSTSKKSIPYQIIDVIPGSRFAILWKSRFIRMTFTYEVIPLHFGSQIRQDFRIGGFFAWPARMLLSSKIRKNLSLVLKQFIKKLEGR